jgi:hypothetical protein
MSRRDDGALVTGATDGAAKIILAAILAVTVCACSSDKDKKIEENIYPTDYKPQILKYLRFNLDDASNIRDAYLAQPVMKVYRETPRYIACVKFNAKDRRGEYEAKEVTVFFFNGTVTQFVETTPELCANAAYQPFPELQKL